MPERRDRRPEEKPEVPADSLAKYRAKRSADSSPEPVGTVSSAPGNLFVVHKHAASHLHFDLRLEMDGVLKSWAVPKGPSYDQADKRLAVHVADHPLEYGDFEGVIPAGNYGAGGVIVWDRGERTPLEDFPEGFAKGRLLFKERDAFVKSPGDQFNETSIKSGLTVEEVRDGVTVNAKLNAVTLSEA